MLPLNSMVKMLSLEEIKSKYNSKEIRVRFNKDFDGKTRKVYQKDAEYIRNNFHYAILEVFPRKASPDRVLERERFWKEVLRTRDFGYNAN